ncbi:MAG TPA: HAD hydrolase-like protein [Burkholderiales bacterium]
MNILFDLDGTLSDPGEGFVACVSYALSKLECPPHAHGEIRRHVGPPLEETLAHLIVDRAKIPAAVAFYRERYASVGYLENAVYPGVERALRELQSRQMDLFVATSKPTVYAERILEHLGLAQFFRAVYGSELDGTRSNKAQLVEHVLAGEALAASRTLFVGDRAQDVAAALAHGLHPIGALWGYGTEAELAAAGARTLCAQPPGLPSVIAKIAG